MQSLPGCSCRGLVVNAWFDASRCLRIVGRTICASGPVQLCQRAHTRRSPLSGKRCRTRPSQDLGHSNSRLKSNIRKRSIVVSRFPICELWRYLENQLPNRRIRHLTNHGTQYVRELVVDTVSAISQELIARSPSTNRNHGEPGVNYRGRQVGK